MDLTAFPKDVLIYAISFLSCSDLAIVSRLDKYFNRIVLDETVWKNLLQREFMVATFPEEYKTYRSYYQFLKQMIFVEAGKSISISKDGKKVKLVHNGRNIATGRILMHGKHKFQFLIGKCGYVGIGVASNLKTNQELNRETLHNSIGCCVYYYTGCYYGYNEHTKSNANSASMFATSGNFTKGSTVEMVMNVPEQTVQFFVDGKFHTEVKVFSENISGNEEEAKAVWNRGMKMAVILCSTGDEVTLVEYSRLK